jgi:hypothetical protein
LINCVTNWQLQTAWEGAEYYIYICGSKFGGSVNDRTQF